ncbi:PLP-dependent aminotransferase family protein [Cohnella boryungensis]|uniref:PLP-dependent aminotransferase family protein n=1 Tax=Cohnella boryungensis TaxID=768479 RepID=A0ABV8SDQ8_9BACL
MNKFYRIADDLEEGIRNDLYREGARLPSVRELSQAYACSKSTAIQALRELESRKVAYAVPRSGHYVLKKSIRSQAAPRGEYDFATSAPDWNPFPYAEFQACIRKAMDIYQQELFGYGTLKGLPSLLKAVRRQLENHQVFAKEERLIVTSGVQQALFILMSMPFPNGKETILVEQPSYHLVIGYLNQFGLKAEGVERTAQGLDLVRLEERFGAGDVKFFYTMPRFHNPLGSSYSTAEKRAILKLAEKYDVYLVEDDFLADYETDGKADPIYSYDSHDRVIYLKSYSKIMFPGLRIGIAVLPPALMPVFQQYKTYIHIDSSMISQAALEIYIQSGMFEHHKNRIKQAYLQRASALNEAVRAMVRELPDSLAVAEPTQCMHTHLVLDRRVNVNQLIERAKRDKVVIETANLNYLTDFPRIKMIKLNVSLVPTERIAEGIRKLTKAIRL